MILPPHIESHFREHSSLPEPIVVLRALTDMHGTLGESYLLSDGRHLLVHSRTVGRDWVSMVEPPCPDLACELASPYLYLTGTSPDGPLTFKFSSFDQDDVRRLIASFGVLEPGAAAKAAPTLSTPTPMIGFAAALHALAHADTVVEEAESRYIRQVIGDEETVRAGFQFWLQLGTQALIEWLAEHLDRDQQICLIANIIELGMADGTLRSIEKETVKWFKDGLAIDAESVAAIFEVLVIKNRVAVFMPA